MADHSHTPNGRDGFEATDAKPMPLIIFTVGLTVLCVISFLLMALMFKLMANHEQAADKPSGYVRDSRWQAPSIQLEVHPSRLREELQKLEHEQLTTYAWIDEAAGKARIPVERAIQILARKGLPHRTDLNPVQEGSPALTESGGQQEFKY